MGRIEEAQQKRERWAKTERKKDLQGEELAERLADVRKTKKKKRGIRQKLANFRLHPGWSKERRENRREILADQVEELEAQEDRLVERIDDLKREEEHAEHLRDFYAERINRLRKKRNDMKNRAGQLTKDFHVAEFACRDGTPVPDGIIPHLKALCEQHLQPLRDSGGSVTINSGFRTPSWNSRVGGAPSSYHIYTLRMKAPAADHIQSGRSASGVYAWHESHDPPDGMGRYATFTHIDDRGYKSRWSG
jgi:Peptidase M15